MPHDLAREPDAAELVALQNLADAEHAAADLSRGPDRRNAAMVQAAWWRTICELHAHYRQRNCPSCQMATSKIATLRDILDQALRAHERRSRSGMAIAMRRAAGALRDDASTLCSSRKECN
jgi:hypothetical protein